MPRQSTQRRALAMEDPDRSLKHQLREIFSCSAAFFDAAIAAFSALCPHWLGLMLRAGLVHCAFAQAAQVPAHPDHAFEGHVCERALVEAVACERLFRFTLRAVIATVRIRDRQSRPNTVGSSL